MCIHHFFEQQVERTPEAVAVVFEGQSLTYRELNGRANQVAHHLVTLGVKPEVLVGICVERSLEMIIGLLGILKAGGAYVPLDPTYPRERLAFMLEDTQVTVLLSQQQLLGKFAKLTAGSTVVCLDTDWKIMAKEREDNPLGQATPNNLAYVMYTSGSTGKPKGVCIIHRGVVRLVKNTNYVNLTATEVFLQFAPLSFDASTFEIWGPLLNGGRLIIMPPQVVTSLKELGHALQRYQITTLWLTAGLFHLMIDERLEDLKPVHQLLAGGDVLSVPHVKKFLQTLKGCRLINGYGPTENTTFTCCYSMTDPNQVGDSVPIGRPIANTQIYVLDTHLQRVPIGVPGELYVGGIGLARGYLNRPELTAEKFIRNPFSSNPQARLYKTGDLVRYRPEGNLEFLGRLDNQVKIRGFRIELGEIEAVISQHPAVRETVVLVREDNSGDKRLVAYVVSHSKLQFPQDTESVCAIELRNFLKEQLPDYMLPAAFVFLDSLPLTPNGKVDRQALPPPDEMRRDLDTSYLAPQTEIEQQLTTLWQTVLHLSKIGRQDNFFDLGGNSLLLIQLHKQLVEVFKRDIPVMMLFQYPTISALAHYLESPSKADHVQDSYDHAQKQKEARHRRRRF